MHFERKCYILTKSVEGSNKKRNQTAKTNEYGQLVKGLRRRPLTAETRVRFPYWLLSKSSWKSHSYCFFRCLEKCKICRCNQKCNQNVCSDYFFAFFLSLLLILLTAAGIPSAAYTARAASADTTMAVHFLDVGQGLSVQHPAPGTDFAFGSGKFTVLSPQSISLSLIHISEPTRR